MSCIAVKKRLYLIQTSHTGQGETPALVRFLLLYYGKEYKTSANNLWNIKKLGKKYEKPLKLYGFGAIFYPLFETQV